MTNAIANTSNASEHFWRRHARFAAARVNFAHWLSIFLPWLFGCSVVFAAALLIGRGLRADVAKIWIVFGAALFFSAAGTLLVVRRRFVSAPDALTRFDVVMRLHNRLTAAAAGIGAWPVAMATAPRSDFRWRWRAILPPLAASLLLVIAAARVPLTALSNRDAAQHPVEQPIAWTQVESWAQRLAEQNLVAERNLDALREAVSDLKKQPSDQWFSQSSLEAGDTLRQQTEQSLRELQRDLHGASEAISALEKFGDGLSVADSKALDEALQKAIQGLEMGNLPLNNELLAELKNIDPSKLRQLSPEQLEELRKRLREGADEWGDALGLDDEDADALIALMQGNQRQQTGAGGPGGGGGPAPLTVKDNPTDLGTAQTEGLAQSDDLNRAAPGDLLGVSKGRHNVDATQSEGTTSGGTISSTGAGGEAVWRNSLTPREREILQRYFK